MKVSGKFWCLGWPWVAGFQKGLRAVITEGIVLDIVRGITAFEVLPVGLSICDGFVRQGLIM